MFVVDQGSVDPGAGLVVDGEVTQVRVSPKEIVFLLVDYQFLRQDTRQTAMVRLLHFC